MHIIMNQEKVKLKNVNADQLERASNKCLFWFYAHPTSRIGLSELAKSINSSKTATKQAVESLIEFNFLNREIVGKAWLISANQNHEYFITKKIPYNLNLVYESGVLSEIYKIMPSARSVILFGSYRWGTDIEGSDIDIAAEVVGNEDIHIINLGIIKQLGYRKNVPVNLHVFSRNKIDLNLFTNIANGIVLDGLLEVRI